MFFEVKHAELSGNYLAKIEFEDGSNGSVDLRDFIKERTVFEKFNDPNYVKSMRIEYGTLVWGQGEVDIAPETLYEIATGRTVVYGRKDRAVS